MIAVGLGVGRRRPEATGHSFLPRAGLEHQAASIVGHHVVESRTRGVECAFAGIREQAAQFGLLTGLEGRVAESQQFVVG